MHTFQETALRFEQFLQEARPFPDMPSTLYDPCRYLLSAGGKRIRPVVCMMAHEIFGDLTKDTFYAALAIELFHNFTLIHDDIMDEAPLRRGKPTIHSRFGLAAGILSGDVMNILAYDQLSKISGQHQAEILTIFNKTAIAVCEGQQWDMDFEKKDEVTVDEYLKMIELKTSVLLASGIQIGALIGGASPEESGHLYAFGKNLGMAFQLQDDYLDTFGTRALIGKQPGGDIRSNKKTFLYIKCQELANATERKLLHQTTFTDPEEKVRQIKNIYIQTGVDKISQALIARYSDAAFASLEKLNRQNRTIPLNDLARQLLHRQQ